MAPLRALFINCTLIDINRKSEILPEVEIREFRKLEMMEQVLNKVVEDFLNKMEGKVLVKVVGASTGPGEVFAGCLPCLA